MKKPTDPITIDPFTSCPGHPSLEVFTENANPGAFMDPSNLDGGMVMLSMGIACYIVHRVVDLARKKK